MKIVEPR